MDHTNLELSRALLLFFFRSAMIRMHTARERRSINKATAPNPTPTARALENKLSQGSAFFSGSSLKKKSIMRIMGKGLFPYIFLDVQIVIIPRSHYLQLFSENWLECQTHFKITINWLKEYYTIDSSCQDLIKIIRKIRSASLPAPACLRLTA